MSVKTKKSKAPTSTKGSRPSGVAVTRTKGGGFHLKAFGPSAPDLRTVIPELLGAAPFTAPDDENEECRTCLGHGRIRDGETKELRRCLDCSGTGLSCR